ncbi:MAG: hypothetical protein [Bacteriophage sp.]|nr:MAG: hypothetical protein [Bacteriophage sp.]
MAVEKFKWPVQNSGQAATTTDSVRTVSFSDGYDQVSGNGINSASITVEMIHFGRRAVIDDVEAFLRAHIIKAFIIKPPGAPLGLYRVVPSSITRADNGKIYSTLNFSIKNANGVYA